MGLIRYDGEKLHFEDRLLVHLQVVIVRKLLRDEGFMMSWMNSISIGGGRTAIWLKSDSPVRFDFFGSRVPAINGEWLQTLQRSADSSTGLIVTNEDGQLARCGEQ